MFLIKVESLMPDLQNLWSEVKRFLLSEETLPVLLISKAVTVVLMCVMSVAKCAYLLDLSMFRCEMFTSRGTVSSNMSNLLFTLSQMLTYYPKANKLSISHMGQFLQGGENGPRTSLLLKLELLCGQTKRF